MKDKGNISGFTLVETAIAMIIIGLLITSVLKGAELIQNAKVASTISQTRMYSAATLTFYDNYNALPGDIANATTLLPRCNGSNFCGNGTGDGKVGSTDYEAYSADQSNTDASPQVETAYFWKHLALADLIDGVSPSASIFLPEWGVAFPYNSLSGGGFTVFTSHPQSGFIDQGKGLALRLQYLPYGNPTDWQPALSSVLSHKIDTKIDDGKPNTGRVQAEYNRSGCDTSDDQMADYQVTNSDGKCMLLFQLD